MTELNNSAGDESNDGEIHDQDNQSNEFLDSDSDGIGNGDSGITSELDANRARGRLIPIGDDEKDSSFDGVRAVDHVHGEIDGGNRLGDNGDDEGARGHGKGNGAFGFVDAGDAEESAVAEQQTRAAVTQLHAIKNEKYDSAEEIRRSTDNLVQRAKALSKGGLFQFPEVKYGKFGNNSTVTIVQGDRNRFAAFDALFGTGEHRPHFDDFCGRIVDHKGRIIDDYYPVKDLIDALSIAGIQGQTASIIRNSFREWAMQNHRNDLVERVVRMLPEWDDTPRVDASLIDIFECRATELNREMGRYLWASLYARLLHPGSMAPIVISLFGEQNIGKSYFGELICKEIMGVEKALPVPLDLGSDRNEFLRNITGKSIVAQIGEMTGFRSTDLNRVKQFVTQTSDVMHYKFEGQLVQQRQWITLMDGNKYEGLQRDDTGNRRFYPVFCGQLLDENGEPVYDDRGKVVYKGPGADGNKWRAHLDGLRNDIWQYLAEAKQWVEDVGISGYSKWVGALANKVFEFSAEEVNNNRGVVEDYELETSFDEIMFRCAKRRHKYKTDDGLFIPLSEIKRMYLRHNPGSKPLNLKHLEPKVKSIKGIVGRFTGNISGVWFGKWKSSASKMNVYFGGEEALTDEDGCGYYQRDVRTADGF